MLPLPASMDTDTDPVASDLADIPRVIQEIQVSDDAPAIIFILTHRQTTMHASHAAAFFFASVVVVDFFETTIPIGTVGVKT